MVEQKYNPMTPAKYDKAVVTAFRALMAGNANESQQKRVLEWITFEAAQSNNLSMFSGPDGDRLTAFAEGRRFVGLQIRKMLDPLTLKVLEDEGQPKTRRGKR